MRSENRTAGFFSRNNFLIGLLTGVCVPVMAYSVLLTLTDFIDEHFLAIDLNVSRGFRERTLSLIAICFNLVPFHLFNRNYADNSMRGMIPATILFVGLWFWYYGRHLLGMS